MKVSPRMDLNLVRVFAAIYETGSVTAAAERLFVNQSTVSYSLSKLREALSDPLFIKTRGGMAATPCAEQTYERFSLALAHIDDAVETTHTFVPQLSDRRFRVAMSDIGELIFLPPLLKKLAAIAPQVELEVVETKVDDAPGWLASGKVDAAVGNLPSICAVTRNAHLFNEHYVCLMRKTHQAKRKPLTREAFIAARHAFVSSSFFGHPQVEVLLQQLGVKVALQIPHFTILPHLIAASDLLVVLPSRVASLFESYGGLQSMPVPIELPSIEVRLHWHLHHKGHAAQQWFLDILTEALGSL